MKIRENVPISTLTTMRLGGPARYVIEIEKPEEIPEAYNFAKSKNLPTFILGGGANTIGHDEGFNGVIIKNAIQGIDSKRVTVTKKDPHRIYDIEESSNRQNQSYLITAMGGEVWDNVVAYACERGLTGIEALSKIPGLAAAAPVQNIGAYGQDIASVFVEAEVYDTRDRKIKTLNRSELHLSYRHSILNTTEANRYFIISITLKLSPGKMKRPFYDSMEKYITTHNITDFSPASIRDIVSKIRANKLPDPKEKASSGSFFKNIYLNKAEADAAKTKGYPIYRSEDEFKINSGWFIQEAGLAGKLIHGMRVNEKATLVLINESAKSYSDLAAARTEIINIIKEKFGYTLEQEPVEII